VSFGIPEGISAPPFERPGRSVETGRLEGGKGEGRLSGMLRSAKVAGEHVFYS
jgi:hypothetical protein